jgi:hypothetical protein
MTNSGSLDSAISTPVLSIGSGGGTEFWQGIIDEVRISKGIARYTSNFSVPTAYFPDSENTGDPNYTSVVLLLHGDNSLLDNSRFFATITNANVTYSAKFGTAAFSMNGTNSEVYTPASANYNFGTGNFTLEAWVYPTVQTNFKFMGTMRSGSVGQWASGKWIFGMQNSAGNNQWNFNANSLGSMQTTGTFALYQWYHVAVVRNGSTFRLYVNGVSSATMTNSGSLDSAISTPVLSIGSGGGTEFWQGIIDEVRISKGIARYTSNFSVPTTAFPNNSGT